MWRCARSFTYIGKDLWGCARNAAIDLEGCLDAREVLFWSDRAHSRQWCKSRRVCMGHTGT